MEERKVFTLAECATHVGTRNSSHKVAFTLAEVLITIGIIGVVAALTIPTLIQKHQEQVIVNKVLKAYSIISQAYLRAVEENGDVTNWITERSGTVTDETGTHYSDATYDNMNTFYNIMKQYLKTVSVTEASPSNNNEIYGLSGTPNTASIKTAGALNLADGTSVTGGYIVTNCGSNEYCGDFAIDINGLSNKPNTIGKDIFYFVLGKSQIIPMGASSNTNISSYCNLNSDGQLNGYACTNWIIQKKNMEYLHCSDLTWNDNKCP